MVRLAKAALGVAVLGGLLFSGASAVGATPPAGGTVNVWGTPSLTGKGGSFVLTGAIGDYGKGVKVNSAGKPDSKGSYSELVMTKGTILVDRTQLQAAVNDAQPTDFNDVTCSASIVTSNVPLPIVSGTKAYAGLTGSFTITVTFAFIGPVTKSGTCNTSSNANPVAGYGSIIGSGTVSFG
jgi:hypothetical protein